MTRRTIAELLGDAPKPSHGLPKAIGKAVDTLGEFEGGDTTNGFLFAEEHLGQLIYVPEQKQWRRHDGVRWAACDGGEHMQKFAAKRAVEAVTDEAIARLPERERKALTKAARTLFHVRNRQSAALASAAELTGIRKSAADLDSDPWLLGVANGVVDLKSGKLIAGRPEQFVTKQAGCAYHPDAEAPQWFAFLERAQPDPEVRDFIRRCIGYTLIGVADEEKLFFAHGPGASGKSTFANVVEAMFGEYAVSLAKALLVRTQHNSEHDRQVVPLHGARMVSVNETSKGDVFDDQRVKMVTSSERVPARFLYREAYSFIPTHTTWFRGNFLPGVQDAGDGFWRRLVPIRFGVQIPAEERVGDLHKRIIAKELPGVLAWAVRGALEWQREGLSIPAAIVEETASYRESTDLFGQWLEDCTVRNAVAKTAIRELFTSYGEYASAAGGSAGFVRSFTDELVRRGYQRNNSRTHGRRMSGLSLKPGNHREFCDE